MAAYYNENDLFAAEWLRNLVLAGLIADGEVDTRSIEDVTADDLKGFQQCHFFAGIGVWSHALRNAGWPDDRVVWTGSCPCQPFSAAGKRGGTADERHLWPAFFHLIEECRPPVVLGEQVASKDGLAWLDLVSADMEGAGYAFGAVDTCAAGFGAPHIRQRLWFVGMADDDDTRLEGWWQPGCERAAECAAGPGVMAGRLADDTQQQQHWSGNTGPGGWAEHPDDCPDGRLADGNGRNTGSQRQQRSGEQRQQQEDGGIMRVAQPLRGGAEHRPGESLGKEAAVDCSDWGIPGQRLRTGVEGSAYDQRPGPLNGFWRDADWLLCRDGKWRPVKPGTFPLAHGIANRVGLLRGAGNAIVSEAAQGFIEAVMDALSNHRL